MRDRLIELLWCASREYSEYTNDLHENGLSVDESYEDFATDYLISHGVILPPCKVGDKFYKVERWCTEGGYWEKPRYAYSSTCEDCCEECDGEDIVIEYTFHSPQQILSLERVFGKYVFLTKEEAEQVLKGGAEE